MTDSILVCPVCDQGKLTKNTYSGKFKHGKDSVTVNDLDGYLCDTCDAEPIFPQQIRSNQLKISDAKRRYDGLLTSAEIKNVRKKLNFTQQYAAKIFGGGANAFSKYERGDVIQSEPMDKLLRIANDSPQIVCSVLYKTSNYQHTIHTHYQKKTSIKSLSRNIKTTQFKTSSCSDWTNERDLVA